jgi:C1A family cysteine protease
MRFMFTREEMIKKLGRIPDSKDYRDYRFDLSIPRYIPMSSSVVKWASPVGDQGNYGSCVFNSATSAMETIMIKDGIPFVNLSRFFAYFNVRSDYVKQGVISGIYEDCGAEIRDAVASLAKLGTCTEALWSYTDAHFAKKPSAACYTDALKRQIITYHRIDTLAQMKTCIYSARAPFILGFNVYESFEEIGSDGLMPDPKSSEELLGGHAVMAVAYDDKKLMPNGKKGALRIRNSWGKDWGYVGDFWMSYDYASNTDEVSDCWRITKGEMI